MRNFTIKEKSNGELAVRIMSKKAQNGYNVTDVITVCEYLDKDLDKKYAVNYDGNITDELTFDEAEKYLEDLYDALNDGED